MQAEACDFIKKETLAQAFSYEFCEISKNIDCYRTPPVAASVKIPLQKTKKWNSLCLIDIDITKGYLFPSYKMSSISNEGGKVERFHSFIKNIDISSYLGLIN